MHRSTPSLRTLAAALFATALLLAGCGTSDGSDASSTTADGGKTTTTVDGGDESTTTEAGGETDGPTVDDLAGLLPSAADIGEGWTEVPGDDDDGPNALSDAIEEQCPAASEFGDDDDDDEEKASVEFASDLSQNLRVQLSPSAEEIPADELTAAVAAISECTDVTVEDEDGMVTTISFTAEEDTDHGDQGIRIQGDVTISAPEQGEVEFAIYILSFRHGTVGISVQGQDGIDEQTAAVNPLDPGEVLVGLAAELDGAVGELVD